MKCKLAFVLREQCQWMQNVKRCFPADRIRFIREVSDISGQPDMERDKFWPARDSWSRDVSDLYETLSARIVSKLIPVGFVLTSCRKGISLDCLLLAE